MSNNKKKKKKKGPEDGPVLVPVDFSPSSEAALTFAAKVADGLKLPIVVLHVVHDPGEAPGYYSVRGRKKQLRRMEDVAKEMLDAFIEKSEATSGDSRSLQSLTGQLVIGLPVTRILEVAERLNPTMVVMGSQGRTGLSQMLLGSKSEKVVRLCEAPVLIVKARTSPK